MSLLPERGMLDSLARAAGSWDWNSMKASKDTSQRGRKTPRTLFANSEGDPNCRALSATHVDGPPILLPFKEFGDTVADRSQVHKGHCTDDVRPSSSLTKMTRHP